MQILCVNLRINFVHCMYNQDIIADLLVNCHVKMMVKKI
jgi:hypothetical protein